MGARIILIVNLHKENASALMHSIKSTLESQGHTVFLCPFEGKPELSPQGAYDIAFTLGGDGTVLYASRCMAPFSIPVFPINIGTLGFIAAVHPEQWEQVFQQWMDGLIPVSRRLMLKVELWRGGVLQDTRYCLNDAVVSASGIAKIIRLDVSTDTTDLGPFRADGLIIATPTGSTAYSVAAGGPILDPELEAFIINPICPFTLSNRPMVIPAHERIVVDVESGQRSNVLLTVDGQEVIQLSEGDRLILQKAPFQAKIIASDRKVFYKVLRTKLNWSGGPDA
ncbi:NAD(+)/NADH kinase [Gracilinema caldarium]|uniref:NAD(+)/NADH kinase n=1 Tax=Gracilinema caldarium TaxID=215591 RepID=UPI0026F2CD10|nr:NAD(+)/NADH kinase [Gracilinema caldarium]